MKLDLSNNLHIIIFTRFGYLRSLTFIINEPCVKMLIGGEFRRGYKLFNISFAGGIGYYC